MQVIHWGKARKFFLRHPKAQKPLKDWKTAVQSAEWKNFPDVKRTWGSVDWVEGKIVFDIKNNDYRLIAIAAFQNEKLYIRNIMTHEEYDKGNWKK
ncbi:MAG: type II toxin-antitoxin system HigB family toxin [Candidatus Obscuribacterales bacterium]|nr:type II toxin-antitoxin system HigB family toxin [Candidatus Obscuribacterales bacterium]